MSSNSDLLARRARAVPRGVGHAVPVFAARAENAELWDVEGRRYIDFAGGIGVLNVGHRHEQVLAAARRQLDLYVHTAFQVTPYEPYIALCERLNALAPFGGEAKTLLVNSGAEAVENAVKIARAATGRSAIVAFSGGFHGRTLLTMGLTGKVAPYKKGAGPMPPEIYHIPFPAPYLGVSVAQSMAALDQLFRVDLDPARVAAIILEPVQGEGGFHEAPSELLEALRTLCGREGILLIADEVQCGMGRTGRMFAIEHSGVEPDLVTVAKSLGGGFPLAAVIGRSAVMDKLDPGGLGGTYAGNPVSCAAALAVLDVMEQEDLLARADRLGARLTFALAGLQQKDYGAQIRNIRGRGAMIAFDLGEPGTSLAQTVAAQSARDGLILLTCGVHGNTVRILVPLTAADQIVDEGLAILAGALEKAMA